MERIRADLIRRARMERLGDPEQAQPEMEQQQRPTRTLRFPAIPAIRPTLPRLFGGGRDASPERRDGEQQVDSPKSPDPPSIRLDLPHLGPTWAVGSGTSSVYSPDPAAYVPASPPPREPPPSMPPATEPVAMTGAVPADPSRSAPTMPAPTSAFQGPDPAEALLAQLAEDGRRRGRRKKGHRRDRQRGHRRGRSDREHTRRPPPKRFLGCFPWVKSRRMRSRILRCFVSGTFLFSLLAVYLGLSLTKKVNKGELTIMLILVILMATAAFCFSLLQLCMLVVRGDRNARAQREEGGPHVGSGGYVVPSQPIRVVMARDEEADGAEPAKPTPPAYGLWRESVRVDPDRMFWQRNDAEPAAGTGTGTGTGGTGRRPETSAGPRPPSYASDDGVAYVVEATPRSTVPTESTPDSMPLPLHPSEVGRVAQTRPAW